MIRFRRVALGVIPLLSVYACSASPGHGTQPSASASFVTPTSAGGTPQEKARAAVAAMSDTDLAGQVLMPYAYGNSATGVDSASVAGNRNLAGVDTPAAMIEKYRLGGLILVGFSAGDPTGKTNPTTNVDDPKQVRALTAGLQEAARKLPGGAPLMIGTDQEYGVVTRITSGVTVLPSAMGAAAAGKPQLTEAAWKAAGEELAAMGITVDFAPDADVLGGSGNTVIGSRSFGDDPGAAADQVAAAVRGLNGAGVTAALKHFPGHGHTTGDSHDTLPVVAQSAADWNSQDLPPFRSGIDAGAGMIMSGHLDVKALDPGTPASFSHKVMTDELRGKLGFTGVAITDAMNMEPAMKWPAGEAAVRALNAGNDMLLMPPDIGAARDGILAGLKNGSLQHDRLVEAVTRILTLKFRTGTTTQPELSTVGSAAHLQAVAALDRASITVLRGGCTTPPAKGGITILASASRSTSKQRLATALGELGVKVTDSGGLTVRLVGYGDPASDLGPSDQVTVMMDSPYLLASAKSPTLLASYSASVLSLKAVAEVLAGKASPAGRSPVAVAGLPRSACPASDSQ